MFRTYIRVTLRLFSFVVCLLFQFQLLCFASSKVEILEPVIQFSFGSCNKETLPQPLWTALTAIKPQFYIWMGDAIYGDARDPKILKEKFQIQLHQPDYAHFIQKTPIIGTWDDHDYGKNNAGRNWKIKEIAQQYFLDFIGEPPVSSPSTAEGHIYFLPHGPTWAAD
ncbi:MAG: alkaline phosphatase family protein [Bdellovibrionales bacterium]|nr:alkaline phosphatase family protein [Bdellovibrionales bacterium]